ncbi:MAG: cbb3-type cytochrome c oxidase subunit I [Burkholderiaceae bacterium]
MLSWVAYAIVGFLAQWESARFGTSTVANWFYGAFIIAGVAAHLQQHHPALTSLTHSYSAYAASGGRNGSVVVRPQRGGLLPDRQAFCSMMYFIPKQAERPVYSHIVWSIVHFWALIFTYMWAGPHHLHYTALPDWTQSIGMIFSLILLAPSWGGMINGIMTLSGAWHKLRDDPILRFLIVSLSFYGMSTFEGPMMSIKTVNALVALHRLDRGSRALGCWLGGHRTMGSMYYLIPRLFGQKKMYSVAAIEIHSGGHHRYRSLHRFHVDRGCDAGSDVAFGQPGWQP